MDLDKIRVTPDSSPLANALREIAGIVQASESDPPQMLDMLNQIEDAVVVGRSEWMENLRAAQEQEVMQLRAAMRR